MIRAADCLLDCVRYYCGTTTELEFSTVNWSDLLDLAYFNSLAPVVYQSLKTSPTVPAAVLDRLSETVRMTNYLNLVRMQELLQIVARLKEQGITAIPFKGLVLAEIAHGNLAMREFGDLDLLVRYQDFWQAKAVLMTQEYSPGSTAIQEALTSNRYCQISLLNPARSSVLDLHWGIPPRRGWRREYPDMLWQNLQMRSIALQTIQTFSVEVTLVIQAVNTVKEPTRRSSLKQACDLAKLICAYPALDWHQVWQVADQLRVRKLVMIGLGVVYQLLQVPLPAEVLTKIQETQAIAEQVAQQIVTKIDHPTQPTDPFWSELWYQLRTVDRAWHAVVISLHFLATTLIVVGMRLVPNERDRQLIALPQSLSFLYYFLRIVRLTHRVLMQK